MKPSYPKPEPGSTDVLLEPEPTEELAADQAIAGETERMAGRAGMVGVLTLISRVFGLIRDSAIAYVLGTKAAADAFYVAFRIPNLLRRMLAEGNLTLSFIPVFTESLHRSKREAKEIADVTFTLLTILLAVITVAGVLGAAWFVRATALGFTEDPAKFALTTTLTKITFPYIFLVSLGALMMGILNARKHFAAPAFAPVMLNLGIIAGALLLARFFQNPSIGIAWGVILGGILQLVIQIPALARQGFLPRFNFNFKIPAVKSIGRLMLPTLYGSAVYQLNLLAITFMASYLPTGSISYLWYADRVIEFPLGIFAISLATVALPTLSDQAAKKNYVEMKKTLRQALSLVWLMNVPAAVGLAILAKPILALLFYRGDFGVESTDLTAQALRYFALGLPFIAASRIVASAFYAVQDARRPVLAANLSVAVNILAGAVLLFPLQHRGLALAVSLGAVVNFLLLAWFYRQKVGPLGLRSLMISILKISFASFVMGALLMGIQRYWDWSFAPTWLRAGYVLTLIIVGLLTYLGVILPLKVEGADSLFAKLGKKIRLDHSRKNP